MEPKTPLTATHAQLGQDRRVAHIFAGKRGGTFVDVGASDGVRFSNTLALERDLGWRGVCVEPEPEAFAALQRNRPDAFCSSAPLLDRSGQEVTFAVRTSRRDGTMLSGIEAMFNAAAAKKKRHVRTLARMTMRTETLPELLDRASMPASIDYLTLDTEGSELAILRGLEGSRYTFKVIHVEHNYREPQRTVLRQYLQARGYKRTAALSWDDEYTLREAKPASKASEEAVPETEASAEAAPQAEASAEAAPQADVSAEAAPETEASAEAAPETEASAEAAPQAEASAEAAPQAEASAEAAPQAHETDQAAPQADVSAEAAPETEASAEAAPETEASAEAAPQAEASAEAAPQAEASAEAAPETEASAEAAPQAHETDQAAPQAHETDQAAPQAHETDQAAPQAHETDQAAPQAHETDPAAPQTEASAEAAP